MPFLILKEYATLSNPGFTISAVIFSRGEISNRKKHYWRKFKKIRKIGLGGVIVGLLLRKFYRNDTKYLGNQISIDKYCSEIGIDYFEIASTTRPSTSSIELIRNLNCDLGISVSNDYISSKLFRLPRQGMINIHHELLPEYQGARSIIWQIYNSSMITGFSIHKISKSIDGGEILDRVEKPIIFKSSLSETIEFNVAQLKLSSVARLFNIIPYKLEKLSLKKDLNSRQYTTPSLIQLIKIFTNFHRMKKRAISN